MSETIANVQDVYQMFLSKITDDMYMELTEEETADLLSELFHNALHQFEFPRVDLYDFDEETGDYNCDITKEEMNIIATYMVVGWLDQQLANIELVRMKYSGSDLVKSYYPKDNIIRVKTWNPEMGTRAEVFV